MHNVVDCKTHYDVIIVGGGHNGLIAANYLAMAGLDVIVVEKKEELGGASVSTRIFPEFDARISRYAYLISLLPNQILDDLQINFKTLRRRTASFTPYLDCRGNQTGLLFSNEDSNVSYRSFIERTGSESEWGRLQKFYELQRAIAGVVWPTLTEPLESRESFLQRLINTDQRQAWDWFVDRPIGGAIEHFIDDDLIRGLVMTDAKIGVFTHPHDESLIQNRCFLYHIIGRGTGEWQVPAGGMGGLIEGLTQSALKRRVTLLTNAHVTNIIPGDSCHSVRVRSDDQEITIDALRVVINASPQRASTMLNRAWHPVSTDEGSVVKINMLLERLPKIKSGSVSNVDAFAGSLHINEGYQQMVDSFASAQSGIVPKPAPCEVYCHTLTDLSILSESLQSRGFHTMTLFGLDAPYRLFTENNESCKEAFLKSYFEGLDSICDESFASCLARDSSGRPCIEVKSALDLEEELGLDQGNIFHNSLSWFFTDDSEMAGTWGVETDIDRIYNCGSSAMRGGAVSGIPGHNAAKRIFEELGIEAKVTNR